MVSLQLTGSFAVITLMAALIPAVPSEPNSAGREEPVRHRQELYLEKSGEATYHAVLDYGSTRWFLAQDYLLFPEEEPESPFTELRPPRQPADRITDVVSPRETTLGFASPWLWFGPMSLEGGLAALERPLEQTPFSSSWDAESGTALSVGRSPPSRLGVAGALGPLSFHHLRSDELRRTVSVLAVGELGEPGPWGEVIFTHDEPLQPRGSGDEPWFLDEPARLDDDGFHGAVRGGINGALLEQRIFLAVSGSRLDPPGFAVVGATRVVRRPWGASLALVEGNYRNGELDLMKPGIFAVVQRKPARSTGHTLAAALSGKRTEAAGAAEEAQLKGVTAVSWKWRPRGRRRLEPRWALDLSSERERRTPGAEESWSVGVGGRPELRLEGGVPRGGESSLKLLMPIGFAVARESGEPVVWNTNHGAELTARLGPVTLSPAWIVEQEAGQEPGHSPKLSLLISWGEGFRAQLGLRAGVSEPLSWAQLTSLLIDDELLEGVVFFRLSG